MHSQTTDIPASEAAHPLQPRETIAQRVPSLDGLRAIAVLLVIAGHLSIEDHHGRGLVHRVLAESPKVGVSLFFVISGFIITRLLAAERAATGHIHLWRFYARRAVRLWPALWLLVLVTSVLGAAGQLAVNAHDVIATLLFVTDYVSVNHSVALFHTWSLAVEEQFYLLWPALLLLLSFAAARRALTVAILAAPLVRVASYVAIPAWRGSSVYQFHDRYDLLAAGCLLALYWDDPRLQRFLAQHYRRLLPICILAVLGVEVLNVHTTRAAFMLVVGYSVEAVSFAGIVAASITAVESPLGRLLNARAVVHIGVISYSLYLWQQMFTINPFGPFTSIPLALLAIFCCAELSWLLVERPLQDLRRRLHPAVNPQRRLPGPAAESQR